MEFKLNQKVFKKNPIEINKRHNKFLGTYTRFKILNRNKVQIKNLKKKIETVHMKVLRKPVFLQAHQRDKHSIIDNINDHDKSSCSENQVNEGFTRNISL